MKRNIFNITTVTILLVGSLASCTKDLNRNPPNSSTPAQVFSNAASAKEALAKVYGAYALTGSSGNGSSDLGGIDAGTSDFIRLLFDANELSTDEAVCAWGDPGVPDFHNLNWTSGNTILLGLYSRCLYQITTANNFIHLAKITPRTGFEAKDTVAMNNYIAEARFLRAFQYWELMDLFANPPFATENDPIGDGVFVPKQIQRDSLFLYVESELKDLDNSGAMVAARQNEYGRADQAAVWALLARMDLNAEIYLGAGNNRYDDAITYSSKVINAGYALDSTYHNLFLADNNLNNPEVILSINYDGTSTQNYGGTTFIINAEIGGSMTPGAYGVPGGGWGGNRVTSSIPGLFTNSTDSRALFYTAGQSLDIASIGTFTDGYAAIKFQNVNSDGTLPAGASVFANTDFPLFRLAEMYLVYAEAVLRGGTGGSTAQAITYFNLIRQRAYKGSTSGNVNSLALQDILDERGRELYWECFRRTDLIRFGQFTTGSYLWPWKGGVLSGTGVNADYNIFPIPSTDRAANPNLTQNPGY